MLSAKPISLAAGGHIYILYLHIIIFCACTALISPNVCVQVPTAQKDGPEPGCIQPLSNMLILVTSLVTQICFASWSKMAIEIMSEICYSRDTDGTEWADDLRSGKDIWNKGISAQSIFIALHASYVLKAETLLWCDCETFGSPTLKFHPLDTSLNSSEPWRMPTNRLPVPEKIT